MQDKHQAVERMINSRIAFLASFHELSKEEINNLLLDGTWTVKDLIGHISAWDKTLLDPLITYLENGDFSPEHIPNHDAWNAVQIEMRKHRPLDEIRDEAISVRKELLAATERLSDLQWMEAFPAPWGGIETFAQMIDGLAWHEEEHANSTLARFKK